MKKDIKDKVAITNRKAKHEYFFERTLVAGLQLVGTEVKAIKDSRVSFVDSYCVFHSNELYLKNLNVSAPGTAFTHDATRDRKLLITRRELDKLQKDLTNGLTIIPYRIFENERGLLKIEIALAKGKKLYDKRESLKERDVARETAKEIKG
jgi:SsrA-binding protein